MIIGNGLIATAFKKSNENYDNVVIFASGVSNSKETTQSCFDREEKLITDTLNENKNLKFIYFSSVLAGTFNNEYYNNKIKFENLIKSQCSDYMIIRAPQIIGENGNKNNIVNTFKNLLIKNEKITVFTNIKRALLDVNDLVNIVNYCKDKVCCETINISYIEKISVLDLVKKISIALNKIPNIHLSHETEKNNWDIENSEIINECINNIGVIKNGYTDNIIKKYINN